jgi:hypothetical protein
MATAGGRTFPGKVRLEHHGGAGTVVAQFRPDLAGPGFIAEGYEARAKDRVQTATGLTSEEALLQLAIGLLGLKGNIGLDQFHVSTRVDQ